MKVLNEQNPPHELKLTLAGQALSEHTFLLRANDPKNCPHTRDAEIGSQQDNIRPITVVFPADSGEDGYATATVTIEW